MPSTSCRVRPALARALLAALVAACAAGSLAAPTALAGTPATVTVRVVGLTGTTLLPQTQVTTSATPIDPNGNPADTCSGTSAAGALDDAVRGNWVVLYEGSELGYQIDGIQGLNFPPFSAKPDAYWSFWMNDVPEEVGACGQELSPGDSIVFFAQCDELGTDCPASKTEPEHFLTETAPSTAQVGAPVAVTVGALNTTTGKPEPSVPDGVTVSAGSVSGSVSAPVNAEGVATLTFSSAGTYTIQANAADSVPSDPHTICVHNGNDGNCGTTIEACPAAGAGCVIEKVVPPPPPAPDVARAGGVVNGRVYSKRGSPRILAGSVELSVGNTLHEVRIALERRAHGRCFAFSGRRGAFVRAGCHEPRFFDVADTTSFSYLLPARLPRGSYVYDVEAVNDAGVVTALTKGLSSVAFAVK
jgi:Domain of unknown function (DUF4430)